MTLNTVMTVEDSEYVKPGQPELVPNASPCATAARGGYPRHRGILPR